MKEREHLDKMLAKAKEKDRKKRSNDQVDTKKGTKKSAALKEKERQKRIPDEISIKKSAARKENECRKRGFETQL